MSAATREDAHARIVEDVNRWALERARLEQLAVDHPTWAATVDVQVRKLDVLIRNGRAAIAVLA